MFCLLVYSLGLGTLADALTTDWPIPTLFQHATNQHQEYHPVSQCYHTRQSSGGIIIVTGDANLTYNGPHRTKPLHNSRSYCTVNPLKVEATCITF